MTDKRPAFQWYPKDILSDENVVLMTLEEEGAYRRLIDYCWLQGSIPSDIPSLAKMCKHVSEGRMVDLWKAIEMCFKKKGDRYTHPRLDLERRKQDAHKKAKSDAGKKGAKSRWEKEENGSAIVSPMAKNGSSSASASATASSSPATAVKNMYVEGFENFWSEYPNRSNPGSKAEAFKRWKSAVVEVGEDLLLEKAIAYRKWCDSQGVTGGDKVAMAQTWLNQKRWEVDLTSGGLGDADRKLLAHRVELEKMDLAI